MLEAIYFQCLGLVKRIISIRWNIIQLYWVEQDTTKISVHPRALVHDLPCKQGLCVCSYIGLWWVLI